MILLPEKFLGWGSESASGTGKRLRSRTLNIISEDSESCAKGYPTLMRSTNGELFWFSYSSSVGDPPSFLECLWFCAR